MNMAGYLFFLNLLPDRPAIHGPKISIVARSAIWAAGLSACRYTQLTQHNLAARWAPGKNLRAFQIGPCRRMPWRPGDDNFTHKGLNDAILLPAAPAGEGLGLTRPGIEHLPERGRTGGNQAWRRYWLTQMRKERVLAERISGEGAEPII